MTVKFNVVGRGKPGEVDGPRKFYPSIQSTGRVTTRELAEQAARMSTLSTVDMMAAIESFLSIIPAELAKGNIVELGEFGSFWLRTESEGLDDADKVSGSLITNTLPRFTPGKLFKQVLDAIDFVKNP